jgi:hypothetical protein
MDKDEVNGKRWEVDVLAFRIAQAIGGGRRGLFVRVDMSPCT